jgi:hypothetical protein
MLEHPLRHGTEFASSHFLRPVNETLPLPTAEPHRCAGYSFSFLKHWTTMVETAGLKRPKERVEGGKQTIKLNQTRNHINTNIVAAQRDGWREWA